LTLRPLIRRLITALPLLLVFALPVATASEKGSKAVAAAGRGQAMSDAELKTILAMTEAANAAWMRGDWDGGYGAKLTTRDDATIYGPFGGPAIRGTQKWAEGAKVGVKQFRNGTSTLELVQAHASGDLVVLVLREEQSGEIGGVADQPWSLRVTLVWRREDGAWRVVHRHADPLVKRRTLPETAAIAGGR
jgi:ketosteroid isomerase-like protein